MTTSPGPRIWATRFWPNSRASWTQCLREKLWTGPQFQTAVHQFTTDENGGFWNWLPLENAIIESAAKTYTTLSNIVYLRASDCLHLITALHHNFAEIYTYDPHQTRAAVALGLSPVAVQP